MYNLYGFLFCEVRISQGAKYCAKIRIPKFYGRIV